MPTEEIYAGAKFTVKGWTENDSCKVLEFLEKLEENNNTDAERLYNLILTVADEGMTHNKQHVRPLGGKIFEFKGTKTGRIAFFYDKGNLIICSHGFSGKSGSEKKFIKKQTKKANRIRDDYFDEVR